MGGARVWPTTGSCAGWACPTCKLAVGSCWFAAHNPCHVLVQHAQSSSASSACAHLIATAALGSHACREHEEMSVQMLDHIIDSNHIDALSEVGRRSACVCYRFCLVVWTPVANIASTR